MRQMPSRVGFMIENLSSLRTISRGYCRPHQLLVLVGTLVMPHLLGASFQTGSQRCPDGLQRCALSPTTQDHPLIRREVLKWSSIAQNYSKNN